MKICPRPEWHSRAACKGLDTEIFFSEKYEDMTTAKSICAECPVQLECQEYALIHPNIKGIWGGNSEREIQTIRRRRLRQNARAI